jgi:tRNA-dihydrouridine synthase
LVDINCGCPSVRITGNKAGSYLLKNPEKIVSMIKILKEQDFVVTAKIRLGFRENNSLEIAKKIEKSGADLLTVHARLANQGSTIPADLKWIKKIRENVGIPVVGNGDVDSGQKAKQMLEFSDGAMIARAAIGNPFIFKQILHYLKTGKERSFEYKEKLKLFERYLKLARKHDVVELNRVKYIGVNFLKGFEGASGARNELMKLKNYDDILKFVRKV